MSGDHTGQKPKILCASTRPLDVLRETLDLGGYEVIHCAPHAAVRMLAAEPPKLVILEGGEPGEPWEAVLEAAKHQGGDTDFVPVVLLVRSGEVNARVRGLRLGADECMDESGDQEEILARVEALLRIKGIQDRMARSREELQKLSTVDPLTGVLNRQTIESRARDELRRARRYQEPLSLMVIDLDAFDAANREHGERAGDEILRHTSRILLREVREVDLVGRHGADTFIVVLPETHLTGALKVTERIWRAVGDHRFEGRGEGSVRLTCSVGLAVFPGQGIGTHDDLIRVGRDALFRAKTEGRNRICLYQARQYLYQPEDL